MNEGRWRLPLRVVALGYVLLLIALPVGFVFYRAFQHGFLAAWDSVTTPDALHALWLTVVVVLIAVTADTIFGVGTSLILARHRFPGVWLLDAFVDLPLALSPVVVGIGLILVYGRTGWFGNWLAQHGIQIIFSVPGIVMASATVALPYVVREVLPVLQEIGTEQEQAAATLGASPFTVFRRITLPSIRQGLAYGVTLTTARVLGEFGAVLVVSGAIEGKTETMTLFINTSVDNIQLTGAFSGAVILALIAIGVLAILGGSDERRPGRWQSRSTKSPSDTEMPLLSTT